MPTWETNCLVYWEGGSTDETGSSGVVSLKVELSGICCGVCGGWFATAQRHDLSSLLYTSREFPAGNLKEVFRTP